MCHGLRQPHGAPLAELVTCECIDQGGIEERGRGEVGTMNEVSMPESGISDVSQPARLDMFAVSAVAKSFFL